MQVELELCKCPFRFLYDLATLTDSPNVLDEIVNHAINVEHYSDFTTSFESEDDCYMDAVARNPHTSLKTLFDIIEYDDAPYARLNILERKNLNQEIISKFAKTEKDFSLIIFLVEKHSITVEDADIIASRFINYEIDKSKCARGSIGKDEEKECIEIIINKCSEEWKRKLQFWWQRQ